MENKPSWTFLESMCLLFDWSCVFLSRSFLNTSWLRVEPTFADCMQLRVYTEHSDSRHLYEKFPNWWMTSLRTIGGNVRFFIILNVNMHRYTLCKVSSIMGPINILYTRTSETRVCLCVCVYVCVCELYALHCIWATEKATHIFHVRKITMYIYYAHSTAFSVSSPKKSVHAYV